MRIDLGDVALEINVRVPGLHRRGIRIKVGAPRKVTRDEREQVTEWLNWRFGGAPGQVFRFHTINDQRKADVAMDLQADQQVQLTTQWTDEMGNPTPPRDGASSTWSVDDESLIMLSDNGDGSVTATATGQLGTANVHLEVDSPDMTRPLSGDLQIVVVAGLAERVTIVPGTPEEATPDDQAGEPGPIEL